MSTPRFAVAAVVAGVLAAALLPGARAGLGLVLVAVALAVAASLAGRSPHPARSAGLGLLALALASSAAIRDAGWVVFGELVGAVVLGSIAMGAPSHWRSTALGALNALFGLFVAVQLAVLFGGDGYVRDTAGLTYAQYARSGFAQLVVVAALTLGVVGGALRWARAERPRDAAILRALLGALCLLTLVVLASALHRLGLYEEAYGFTRMRLAVHALLLFGGALFVLVVAALASGRRDWLARATVVLGALAALTFWVGDPDRRIAAHNVERYEDTGRIDTYHLSKLSADAVPALLRLPAPLREQALGHQRARLAREGDGLAGANWARARARDALTVTPGP